MMVKEGRGVPEAAGQLRSAGKPSPKITTLLESHKGGCSGCASPPSFTALTTLLQGNVKDTKYDVDFFNSFDLVLNGLDNMEARRHVNRLTLAAGTPLVESGTEGYLGQVLRVPLEFHAACHGKGTANESVAPYDTADAGGRHAAGEIRHRGLSGSGRIMSNRIM